MTDDKTKTTDKVTLEVMTPEFSAAADMGIDTRAVADIYLVAQEEQWLEEEKALSEKRLELDEKYKKLQQDIHKAVQAQVKAVDISAEMKAFKAAAKALGFKSVTVDIVEVGLINGKVGYKVHADIDAPKGRSYSSSVEASDTHKLAPNEKLADLLASEKALLKARADVIKALNEVSSRLVNMDRTARKINAKIAMTTMEGSKEGAAFLDRLSKNMTKQLPSAG
jgi:hypothetical protein